MKAPSPCSTFDPADPTPDVRRAPARFPASAAYTDDSAARLAGATCSRFTGSAVDCAAGKSAGAPVIELAHASDNPYVDLFVRISEVDAAGRLVAMSAKGFVRLDPDLEARTWSVSNSMPSRIGSGRPGLIASIDRRREARTHAGSGTSGNRRRSPATSENASCRRIATIDLARSRRLVLPVEAL